VRRESTPHTASCKQATNHSSTCSDMHRCRSCAGALLALARKLSAPLAIRSTKLPSNSRAPACPLPPVNGPMVHVVVQVRQGAHGVKEQLGAVAAAHGHAPVAEGTQPRDADLRLAVLGVAPGLDSLQGGAAGVCQA
jgi:hypothetical protein